MMQFVIDFEPLSMRFTADSPILLRDAAARASVPLKSICGGKATCGKCLVRVSGAALSPVTEAERRRLSEAEIAAGYRQVCCTLVSGDASVYVRPSSLLEEQRVQVEGAEVRIAVDPIVRKLCLAVPLATLADQRGDWDRVAAALRAQTLTHADLRTHTHLSTALRTPPSPTSLGGRGVTMALRQGELIAAEPGDTTGAAVGLAVDLGTTKIACYLVDLLTGRTLVARGVMNPQIAYGEDVIARIEAAGHDQATHRHLQEIVVDALPLNSRPACVARRCSLSTISFRWAFTA